MIVRSGLALTIPVLFSSGHPDGDIAWNLFGETGAKLSSGVVQVPDDAVSINLEVSPENNLLSNDAFFGSRDFEWSYRVNGALITGEKRYSIEARAPYGASNDGVRAKLGVETKDLPDADISLIRAFISFRDTVTPRRLDQMSDDADLLSVRDAIEAQAALSLIPTMAVRVAVQEDSGTNAYKRQPIDWDSVAENLSTLVNQGILVVDPRYDPSPTGELFILARPSSDPITGGSYS